MFLRDILYEWSLTTHAIGIIEEPYPASLAVLNL